MVYLSSLSIHMWYNEQIVKFLLNFFCFFLYHMNVPVRYRYFVSVKKSFLFYFYHIFRKKVMNRKISLMTDKNPRSFVQGVDYVTFVVQVQKSPKTNHTKSYQEQDHINEKSDPTSQPS